MCVAMIKMPSLTLGSTMHFCCVIRFVVHSPRATPSTLHLCCMIQLAMNCSPPSLVPSTSALPPSLPASPDYYTFRPHPYTLAITALVYIFDISVCDVMGRPRCHILYFPSPSFISPAPTHSYPLKS